MGALLTSVALGTLPALAQAPPAGPGPGAKTELKSLKEKASYALGMSIGRSLKQQAVEVSPDLIVRGLRDAIAGGNTLLTEQEADESLARFQEEAINAMSERGKKEGAAYLTLNGKKPDVKTTASGLQYKILKAGTGPKPKAEDMVTAHYKGTLVDGKEFDNSYKRGEPLTIPVTGVIPGWTEALLMMPVGSKWQLTIPASLAYGEQGRPPVIAPNSTLLFDIELLGIGGQKPGEQEPVLPKIRPGK